MSEPQKEMSHEYRTLLAVLLSVAVIALSAVLLKPKQPPVPQTPPAQTASQSQSAPVNTASATPPPAAASPQSPKQPNDKSAAPTAESQIATHVATSQRTLTIESADKYRVVLSNVGGVARNWVLLLPSRVGDTKPEELDVVHAQTAQLLGWPLSLAMDDQQLEARANSGLYEVTVSPASSTNTIQAPCEVDFVWSDGHLSVTKKLKFDASNTVGLSVDVELDGQHVPASIAWRGGFGDPTAEHAGTATLVFYSLTTKFNTLAANKLGQPNQTDLRTVQSGPLDFTGIEDNFFAAAFLPRMETLGPRTGLPDTLGGALTLTDWAISRDVISGSSTSKELTPEMAVGSARGTPLDLRLFVGPKNLDELKAMRPPLNELVQFGWWGFIAEPMFYVLRWVHNYIPNYGWAIVALTFAINMVMFPLTIKSYRSMQKMQKVAPEIKSIQERYKKYGMRDPRKQKMNEEVMAVYSREGISPLGGCLPMMLQMPLWLGLNRMITSTIELRHAPWFGWIHDLSARDPYYILPVIMAISMYVAQLSTPTPAGDASQQKMMKFMPLMFGGMFIIYPVPTGLVVYILTSSLVNLGQRWMLNRTMPTQTPVKAPGKKK
ncbi:MAG TPA: membrane protein insertase YidC [Candidatus Acidoferrales bacterium]|nr:membrane protein insertase YidC [Candidatus Acidoferrales bacterium]